MEEESDDHKPKDDNQDGESKRANGQIDGNTATRTTISTNGGVFVDSGDVRLGEVKNLKSTMENGGAPTLVPSFGEKDLLNLPAMDEELVKPGKVVGFSAVNKILSR